MIFTFSNFGGFLATIASLIGIYFYLRHRFHARKIVARPCPVPKQANMRVDTDSTARAIVRAKADTMTS